MTNCNCNFCGCCPCRCGSYRRLIAGPKGSTGATGATGIAAFTLTVGQTVTGEPGTSASVVQSGTDGNILLDFTIPRGATGATGATGMTGPQGLQGIQGERGATGATGATEQML